MSINAKNKKTALILAATAAGMFGFVYLSFPLYTLFCRLTGYGGTPRIVDEASTIGGEKYINVRFNADTDPKLAWKFEPMQPEVRVKTGENNLVFYTAENLSSQPITGMATYNVLPEKAAYFFSKIQCFCFEEQTLQPGEKVEMPISFFVDPEIESDLDAKDVKTVTLSYTFFKAKEQASAKN